MQYNKNQAMTLMGTKTPKSAIHKSESHKLHQAFPVAEGVTIIQGMPVQIDTEGAISPYYGKGTYIGIATTNSEYPAYEDRGEIEVTVAVEGYAIVCGMSNGQINAGSVVPVSTGRDDLYVTYGANTADTNPKFIALHKTSGAGELMHVLVR